MDGRMETELAQGLAAQSKLPDVGTTIFTQMSALAAEEGALNLSQGFPDFDGPQALLERVQYYLTHGHNQYAPMTGVATLRQEIAHKVHDLYRLRVDADQEVTVTSGATEALFCAISAVVRLGDEVVLFDPAYDSYAPVIELCGGVARHVPMIGPEFGIDWNRVDEVITDRTRLIITNSPHNPTGSVWGRNDIDALRTLVRNRPIFLVADEVYEHICFDGQPHLSLCRFPDLWQRSFVVSSFGKTYHTTGWKIGYCVAPAALTQEFRKIHQFNTFTTITPVQLALADFLREHPEHHLELADFYQAKRDLFCSLLEHSRFTFTPAAGTYFQLLEYGAVSTEPDVALAQRLTREAKLASIPISVFYASSTGSTKADATELAQSVRTQRYLRFCFAKDNETLARAAEILCAL